MVGGMSTDRELLEAAAKAAGIKLIWNDRENPGYWSSWKGLAQWEDWNPLTDDGDAFRLAVKLGIAVYAEDCEDYLHSCACINWERHFIESNKDDPYAATRRAVVRAAAAMGAA